MNINASCFPTGTVTRTSRHDLVPTVPGMLQKGNTSTNRHPREGGDPLSAMDSRLHGNDGGGVDRLNLVPTVPRGNAYLNSPQTIQLPEKPDTWGMHSHAEHGNEVVKSLEIISPKGNRGIRRSRSGKREQQGIAAVEFALIAPLLFALILGIIDFGRMMYTMNLLQESTRRVAEAASQLFPDSLGRESARRAGMIAANGDASTLINGLTIDHIELVYLNADGAVIPSPANCTSYDTIRFVSAQLLQGNNGYAFEFVTPVNLLGFPQTMDMPSFQVILPRESMGWTENGTPCSVPASS